MKAVSIPLILFLIVSSVIWSGCDDNPADHDDDHDHGDHAEVEFLQLVMDDVIIYNHNTETGEVSCEIGACGVRVAPGERTALISVQLLNDEGAEVHLEDLGEEFSLEHEIDDGAVASLEWEDLSSFYIRGENAGATRMQLRLMHGDHEDLITPPLSFDTAISVVVQ